MKRVIGGRRMHSTALVCYVSIMVARQLRIRPFISSVTGFSSIEYFRPGLGNTGIRWLLSGRTYPNIRIGCTMTILSRLAKLLMNAKQKPHRRKKTLLQEAIPPKEGRLFPVNSRMPQKRRWLFPCAIWSKAASKRYVNSDESRCDYLTRLLGHSLGSEFRRCRSHGHTR